MVDFNFDPTEFLSGLPGVGGLFDPSEKKGRELLEKNMALYENMALPEFAEFKPDQYEYAGDYIADQANAKTITEDPELKSRQMSALSRMAGLADKGLSEEDTAVFDQARRMADAQARSSSAAALQNARARGVAGSGMEFAMREAGNQAAADRAASAGLEQAATSGRQRALYAQAYGDALSGVRGQDFNANSANANILNQFNMANTSANNQAKLRNLETRQQMGNENVDLRNQARQYNDQMKQQGFQNQMARAGGMTGQNDKMANYWWAKDKKNSETRKAKGAALGSAIGGAFGGPMGAQMGGSMGNAAGDSF